MAELVAPSRVSPLSVIGRVSQAVNSVCIYPVEQPRNLLPTYTEVEVGIAKGIISLNYQH
jgi:hypothetical protein